MRKIIAGLIFTFCLCPLGFAQYYPLPGVEALFKEYSQTYSKMLKNSIKEEHKVAFASKIVEGKYYTEQQMPPEYAEFDESAMQNLEKYQTNSYKELTISVPEGYSINKNITYEGDISFLPQRSILLFATDKEFNDVSEISFNLDYDITFKNPSEVTYKDNGRMTKALTLKIRFSPKYFTWKRVGNNYDPTRTKDITYNGKKITLRTRVISVLTITTPKGEIMEYVLEPNFQEIYNDFKFVRDGYRASLK